jgi:hypothetical protein
MARYLITSELGPQRHTTPEGFLICTGVPIARTGEYEYYASEGMSPGIEPDASGRIISRREPEQVFAPAALASFEGKPVTLGHPDVDEVTPDDWRQYAVGHVTNVRRGEGDDADKVIADLIISDAAAIDAINGGLREVSCGYDVTVEQVEPGVERQTHIRGNHVALVPAGRAGSECAIRDSKGGVAMDKEVKEGSLFSWDQVKEMLAMLLGKGGGTETVTTETTETTADACKDADEIDKLKARIAELEAERDALRAEVEGEAETDLLDEEAIVETTAEEKTDAKPLGFANRVEILAPGMRYDLPKTDAKADARKAKLDAMRRALDRACDDDRKRAIIMSVAGRKVDNWAAVKDSRVALVFKAASAALATINNSTIPSPVSHGDAAQMDDYAAKVAERYAKFGK